MQKIIKALAAALAIACLAGCALVRVNPDRVYVAQVKDEKITLTQYLNMSIPYFNQYQINPLDTNQKEDADYITDSILEMMIIEKVAYFKMAEWDIKEEPGDREENEREVAELMQERWDVRYNAFRGEYPEATHEEAVKDADDYQATQFNETYTYDDYLEDALQEKIYNKLIERATEGVDVTEAEVREAYNANLSKAKEDIAASLSSYQVAVTGGDVYYTPEGIFYIKHVLVGLEEGKPEEIAALRQEGKDDEADAMLEEELAKVRERADLVLEKVNAGEDFDALIAEYNTDPGMTQEPAKTQGYMMYEGNEEYVAPFYEASMALEKDGDVSGLVASDFGYHIIKRVSTVEPGEAPYEEKHDALYETMLKERVTAAFQEKLAQWKEEYSVKIWKNRIQYTF